MSGLPLSRSILVFLLFSVCVVAEDEGRVYVVYMGATPPAASPGSLEKDHLQLLASVVRRNIRAERTLVRSYRHGFSGFAARLVEEEALAVARKPGVVSVFVEPVLQLHTTRSWTFLQGSVMRDSIPSSADAASVAAGGADTIVGLLDTGIWPESASFDDGGMDKIPGRWKGKCVEAHDFNASNCNRKLIGARSYVDMDVTSPARALDLSPRDTNGHGTHTASTAAGAPVPGASYYGLAGGTARGGSTSARLAMYKVCGSTGCPGSAILAAFDDAIADGVDVLSLSLGQSPMFRQAFSTDPIGIGSFHAVAKGIAVVCSAGNSGPGPSTVVNAAPWILTVAATTIDRDFESDVVLGGNHPPIKGEAINFSNLDESPIYPLIYGASAKPSNASSGDNDSAKHCEPHALDGNKIKGRIVLCEYSPLGMSKKMMMEVLQSMGATGVILVNDQAKAVASTFVSFPVTEVSSQGAQDIVRYINSTRDPVATIQPTVAVTEYKPAPVVAFFSSRGPAAETRNILKPDIAAPGVNILAAWPPSNESSVVPPGKKPSGFNVISGTSMSCPHVSGVVATIKSSNPTWSPSAIRSAIMTTATQTNNAEGGLTLDSGSPATPYDYGAGEINPSAALRPGLVYEAETHDYLLFLCNVGLNATTIGLISPLPDGFECPENAGADAISDLNYPSIAVSSFDGKASRTVSRTVTNVGDEAEAVYVATVTSAEGLDVKVTPGELRFTQNNRKASYQVTFSAAASSSLPLQGDLFGSISWSHRDILVRSPFLVTSRQ